MWWLVGVMLLLISSAGIVLERVITRYISLQALMEKQKRLTLIGQMSAVIAHEIRNALVSVKGYAQWINEKPPEPESLKTSLEAILQGTGRIESLVNELLIFSRQEHYNTESIDLKKLIDEAAGSGLAGWQGKTEIEIGPGKFVTADREKLSRVMVNGMRNVVEAMSGEGTLRIASVKENHWIRFDRRHGTGNSGRGSPSSLYPILHDEGGWHGARTCILEKGSGRHERQN